MGYRAWTRNSAAAIGSSGATQGDAKQSQPLYSVTRKAHVGTPRPLVGLPGHGGARCRSATSPTTAAELRKSTGCRFVQIQQHHEQPGSEDLHCVFFFLGICRVSAMTRYRAAEVATLSFLRGTLNQQRTRPRRVTLLRSGVVIHEQPALFLGHALAPFHVRCDERMLA